MSKTIRRRAMMAGRHSRARQPKTRVRDLCLADAARPRDLAFGPRRDAGIGARGGVRLEWLVRHQADDGSWSSSCLAAAGSTPQARCEAHSAVSRHGKRVEMAHTGLAVLALQAGGHYDANGNSYSENVARAIRWMIAHQGEDGALIGSLNAGQRLFPDYMYEHGIATFALAEACALAAASGRQPETATRRLPEAAVRFIQQQQHDDGGWRYTADKTLPSDTSISSWQVLALSNYPGGWHPG